MSDIQPANLKGMSVLGLDKDMVEFYKKNANIGSENLGGTSPLLKLYSAGKTKDKLADGKSPTDGFYFYKPTREQFQQVDCHILMISKSFRANGLDKKNVFNQIMAGIIVNDNKRKPFMMYLTGLKLAPMWDFGKEVSKYVHSPLVPTPMFAIRVLLTSERVDTKFGYTWIPKFNILKNESGMPYVVQDKEFSTYLLSQIEDMRAVIDTIIEGKILEDEDNTKTETMVAQDQMGPNKETIDPFSIPI